MNNITYVGEKKYSVEMFIRAFEYFTLTRATYNRLGRDYQLPSISTLTRITTKVKNNNSYIHKEFSNLTDERQKTCVLLLDEVYAKAILLYHGGVVFGHAVNKPSLLANTVLSFMVVTLFGGPNFLCKMLPVRNLDAKFLFDQTNLILNAIKTAGGNVVAIISDGSRVNQNFLKMFYTIVPWRTKDDIFLLFVFVHLFKGIRNNNWITEKMQELEFYIDGERKIAKWTDIKALFKFELNQIVKMSKLSEISVNPKPVERQGFNMPKSLL